jgi:hypothetical protein
MDIKDIHKFCIDENAWYHVILPSGTSNEDLMGIRERLSDSGTKGTFIITTEDMTIEDVTDEIMEIKER